MPKDNIDRAIKRGTGELGGAVVEELLYEGFGPGNVAILVEALTDNRNRTGPDVRNIFNKNGGRIAEGGGVAYQFAQQGVIRVTVPSAEVERLEEVVIEGGGEDYRVGEGHASIFTGSLELHPLKEALEAAGFSVDSAAMEYVANAPINLDDEETLEKLAHLIETLEEYDDVTHIYTNLSE
jgi:YebC/PmpR family DNA-binding regulatory protein